MIDLLPVLRGWYSISELKYFGDKCPSGKSFELLKIDKPGWLESFSLMTVGSSYKLYIEWYNPVKGYTKLMIEIPDNLEEAGLHQTVWIPECPYYDPDQELYHIVFKPFRIFPFYASGGSPFRIYIVPDFEIGLYRFEVRGYVVYDYREFVDSFRNVVGVTVLAELLKPQPKPATPPTYEEEIKEFLEKALGINEEGGS